MIVTIDAASALRLASLRGKRLARVVGHRYPNPALYDSVQLITEAGAITEISLRSHDVAEKLEVCCIVARPANELTPSGYDDFRLADFNVDQVFVSRRAEWLEMPEHPVEVVGHNAEEQRISDPSEAPPWIAHALVDAGITLVDRRASKLIIRADSFPLVMQLNYVAASASLPNGELRELA